MARRSTGPGGRRSCSEYGVAFDMRPIMAEPVSVAGEQTALGVEVAAFVGQCVQLVEERVVDPGEVEAALALHALAQFGAEAVELTGLEVDAEQVVADVAPALAYSCERRPVGLLLRRRAQEEVVAGPHRRVRVLARPCGIGVGRVVGGPESIFVA